MKGTSSNGKWDSSAPTRREAKSLQVRVALAALAAGALMVGLSGCASPRGSADEFEPNVYNPNTGYPAIGGGAAWHM